MSTEREELLAICDEVEAIALQSRYTRMPSEAALKLCSATRQGLGPEKGPEELAQDVRVHLMTLPILMAPIWESAAGVRADAERSGMSPTMADQIAANWAQMAIAAMVSGNQ